MANVILNEHVNFRRRAKLNEIKDQLDVKNCSNAQSLLVELEKAKYELTLNHSFQSMGILRGLLALSKVQSSSKRFLFGLASMPFL